MSTFKNYISIFLYESTYYFPFQTGKDTEIIELLNLLSCNFPHGGYPDEQYLKFNSYYLNRSNVSKKDIVGPLHEETLKFIINSDENNYTNLVDDLYYDRLIQFKHSKKYQTITQMESKKDPTRFSLKNDIMRWIIHGNYKNFDINEY